MWKGMFKTQFLWRSEKKKDIRFHFCIISLVGQEIFFAPRFGHLNFTIFLHYCCCCGFYLCHHHPHPIFQGVLILELANVVYDNGGKPPDIFKSHIVQEFVVRECVVFTWLSKVRPKINSEPAILKDRNLGWKPNKGCRGVKLKKISNVSWNEFQKMPPIQYLCEKGNCLDNMIKERDFKVRKPLPTTIWATQQTYVIFSSE